MVSYLNKNYKLKGATETEAEYGIHPCFKLEKNLERKLENMLEKYSEKNLKK